MSLKQLMLPMALMSYGTLETAMAPNQHMLNYRIGHAVMERQPNKIWADNVLQYVPTISVYALNMAGVKGKNNVKDRTLVLGISALLTAITVNTMKYSISFERPDKSNFRSFPSGHTTVAFMGAEFLRSEYKDVSGWIGVAGYTIATSTAALRVYNNKHWVGDVAFGAGLGILNTRLAYLIHESMLKSKLVKEPNKNKANMTFLPYYNGQQTGIAIAVAL